MIVGLNEDQRLIFESADGFLSSAYDFQTRQKIVADEPVFLAEHWEAITDLGWLGAPFAEDAGGFGLPLSQTGVFHRAIGQHLFVSPYFSSITLAGGLIDALADREQSAELLAPILSGEQIYAHGFAEPGARFDVTWIETTAREAQGGYVLNGEKSLVQWAAQSSAVLVTARTSEPNASPDGISVFVIPTTAPGLEMSHYRTVDGHSASTVKLTDVVVPKDNLIGPLGGAYPSLELVYDYAMLALCMEAVGCMSALHDLTLTYLKQREQFGRPIGKFQVMQHSMVDINVETDTAAAMTFGAAKLLDQNPEPDQRRRLISSAKAQVGWSGRKISQLAVGMHGGIGMTNDIPVGHHLKRLGVIGTMFGDSSYHVRRVQSLDHAAPAGTPSHAA